MSTIHRGVQYAVYLTTLLFLGLVSFSVPAVACTGDCDGDGDVAIDELVRGVGIALELSALDSCQAFDADGTGGIEINELVASVRAALDGCAASDPTSTPSAGPTATPGEAQEIRGYCLRPGTHGLSACDRDTRVRAWACEDRALCPQEGRSRTYLGEGRVGAMGAFAIALSAARTTDLILLEAELEDAFVLRTLKLPIGAGQAASSPTLQGETTAVANGVAGLDVLITPASEAGVRLLAEAGLQNFIDRGVPEVIGRAQTANAETDFSGLSVPEAADRATETARENLLVRDSVESNRILQPDSPVSTRINPAGDLDLYGFDLQDRTTVLLRLVPAPGAPDLRLCLQVTADVGLPPVEQGTVCAYYPGQEVFVERELSPGRYFVLVYGSGTGDYNLSYQPVVVQSARELLADVPAAETLSPAGDLDLYHFDLQGRTTVVLRLVPAQGASDLRSCLQIIADVGLPPVEQGTVCAYYPGQEVFVERELSPGRYFVLVYGSETGDYNLFYVPLILPL